MPVVTNVRVESNGPALNVIRWTDNGGASNDIYRSVDGAAFSLLANVALGVEEYSDEDLLSDTRYFYTISNDGGALFSTTVSVWTHPQPRAGGQAVVPSYSRQDETLLHQLSQNAWLGADSPSDFDKCVVCPVEGRLILDCTIGCVAFSVTLADDINSIAIIGCPSCPPVDFRVPAGTTIGICGWPRDNLCEYAGDECFQAPVEGGDNGRVARTIGASTPLPAGARLGLCVSDEEDQLQCQFPFTMACKQTGIFRGPQGEGGFTGWACEDFQQSYGTTCDGFCLCWWECDQEGPITLKACGGTGPYVYSTVPQGDCVECCYTPGVDDILFTPSGGDPPAGNPVSVADGQEVVCTVIGCYTDGCNVNHEEIDIMITDDRGNSIVINGWIGV